MDLDLDLTDFDMDITFAQTEKVDESKTVDFCYIYRSSNNPGNQNDDYCAERCTLYKIYNQEK